MTDQFALKKPCVDCPFRSDRKPFITAARAADISEGNMAADRHFYCHKTVELDKTGQHCANPNSALHCAGYLIMSWNMGQPSQMARIAGRIGLYKPEEYSGTVFETPAEMIKHHRRKR